MKRNMKKIIGAAIGLSLCLGLGVSFATNNKANLSANASVGNYSTNAATYYNNITASNGKQLAAQLHDLITSTHRQYTSYDDNGKNLYQQHTDQYYENGSPVNGYINDFYSGVKWPNGWNPDAGKTNGGYNREHVWCQSNSVNSNGQQMWGTDGGGADMHHIRPTETRLNSTRNNHPYGEVDDRNSHKVYAKLGNDSTYALGGYCDGSADIFEPLDSKKGDVARILLYVYLHYNSYTVSTLFGSYGTTNGNGNSSYFSSSLLSLTKITSLSSEASALTMLLDWNASDPVDELEQRRNEQVAIYQGNRNPFIDNSNYAELIWGNGTPSPTVNSVYVTPNSLSLDLNGTSSASLTANVSVSNGAATTVSWTSSNTNVATVTNTGVVNAVGVGTCTITARSTVDSTKYSTASVSVSDSGAPVVNSVTISPSTLNLDLNGATSGNLTANVSVSNGASQNVIWTSSNTGIASVSQSGVVTAVAKGSCTITATSTVDSTKSGTATVKVINSGGGEKSTFTIGWGAATGEDGTFANFSDISGTVDDLFSFVCEKNSASSSPACYNNTEIRLYYNASGDGCSITITPAEGITITDAVINASNGYTPLVNYSVDSGALVSVDHSNNKYTINDISASSSLFIQNANTSKNLQLRIQTIEISYEEQGVTPVKTLSGLSLDTTNCDTEFTVGDTFTYQGLVCTASYSDGTTASVVPNSVSSPDMSTAGTKTITVTYSENSVTETATYEITVSNPTINKITASVSKVYHPGDVILACDIDVIDNLGNEVVDFEFTDDGYMFTYDDTDESGHETVKVFTQSISYGTLTCSLGVTVSRKAHVEASIVSDTLNRATTGITGTNYSSWSGKTLSNGITYAGASAGGNDCIQLRSSTDNSGNHSGVFSTANANNLTLSEVSLTWSDSTANSRRVDVYVDNTPYTSPEELFGSNYKGTFVGSIICGTSTTLSIPGSFKYLGLRSYSSALYLEEINIYYGSSESAENLANFIMYEDTNGQCNTKFEIATGYFGVLTSSEQQKFMNDDDYVISSARARFLAWARYHNTQITYLNGEYVFSKLNSLHNYSGENLFEGNSNSILILLVICTVVVGAVSIFYLLKKKKKSL